MTSATDRSRRQVTKRSSAQPATVGVMRDLAHVEVASTELARDINRDIALELIRAHQPIARVDLVRLSGLQNSTVSSIVEQLLTEGWIREGEAVKTARGRRPTQISLNDRLAMLVADVRPGHADLAAVDLNGQILSRASVQIPADALHGVDAVAGGLLALRTRHPEHTFEGAGICLPGRIDPSTRQLLMAPNLRWHHYAVGERVADQLGMSVELENDANACLLAELWFGHLDGVRNAVVLAISEGLGASILAGGQLVSGHQGMAGEFGHICYSPQGPVCGCGRRGCWEVYASSTAALRAYTRSQPGSDVTTYRELVDRAQGGDGEALAALEGQATAIGRGLRMVVAALAPEVISFAGEITMAWPLIETRLQEACAANLLCGTPPRLLSAGDADTAHLLGAAAVVLQRHPGYYRARAGAPRIQGTHSRFAEMAGKTEAHRTRTASGKVPA